MKIYRGRYFFNYEGRNIPKQTPLFVSVELCLQYMEKKGINREDVAIEPYDDAYIETIKVFEELPCNIRSDKEIEDIFADMFKNL